MNDRPTTRGTESLFDQYERPLTMRRIDDLMGAVVCFAAAVFIFWLIFT